MNKVFLKNAFLSLLILAFAAAYSYWLPRFLSGLLGESSPWISFFYTYAMGGFFFCLSSIWIFSRKASPERRREERLWLAAVSCGMLFMFAVQALWIFLAVNYPEAV